MHSTHGTQAHMGTQEHTHTYTHTESGIRKDVYSMLILADSSFIVIIYHEPCWSSAGLQAGSLGQAVLRTRDLEERFLCLQHTQQQYGEIVLRGIKHVVSL